MTEDPFSILKLRHDFDLTNAEIEAAYLRCIAAVHPDLNDSFDSDPVSRVNEARKTLLEPESRANALLSSLGGPDAKTYGELPELYLLSILDQRMEIEEEIAANAEVARPKWTSWAEAEQDRIIAELRPLFRAATAQSVEIRRQIRTGLNAWRYMSRLIEQLRLGYDPGRNDFL
jgi:curved DNA-binding protein CbpA